MKTSTPMLVLHTVLTLAFTVGGCDLPTDETSTETGVFTAQEPIEALNEIPGTEDRGRLPENDTDVPQADPGSTDFPSEELLVDENEEGQERVPFGDEAERAAVADSASNPADEQSPVTFMPLSDGGDVVDFVEIDRYMGQWYEIATTPSFQQAACFGTSANYVFNDAQGWVDVTNSCYSGSLTGNLQEIKGRAELDDQETQAKLFVIFFNQKAPYWVVALDGSEEGDQYQWAVVSVPGGQTMWLLSRTKEMDPAQREAIEAHLVERGFPVEKLIETPHGD